MLQHTASDPICIKNSIRPQTTALRYAHVRRAISVATSRVVTENDDWFKSIFLFVDFLSSNIRRLEFDMLRIVRVNTIPRTQIQRCKSESNISSDANRLGRLQETVGSFISQLSH